MLRRSATTQVGIHMRAHEHRLTHGRFEEAFFPEPHIGVAGRGSTGDWVVWSGHLPPAPGIPGDPLLSGSNPFTLTNYLLRCIDLLKTLMLSVIGLPDGEQTRRVRAGPALRDRHESPRRRIAAADHRPHRARRPERHADDGRGAPPDRRLHREDFGRRARRHRDRTTAAAGVEDDRRGDSASRSAMDLALNVLRALASQVGKELRATWSRSTRSCAGRPRSSTSSSRLPSACTAIACCSSARAWMRSTAWTTGSGSRRHGATKTCLESRFLTGIYDFLFAL